MSASGAGIVTTSNRSAAVTGTQEKSVGAFLPADESRIAKRGADRARPRQARARQTRVVEAHPLARAPSDAARARPTDAPRSGCFVPSSEMIWMTSRAFQ